MAYSVINLKNLFLSVFTIWLVYTLPVSLSSHVHVKICEDTLHLHNFKGSELTPVCEVRDENSPFVANYPHPEGQEKLDPENMLLVKSFFKATSVYLQSLLSNNTVENATHVHRSVYYYVTRFWLMCMKECTFMFHISNRYNTSNIYVRSHDIKQLEPLFPLKGNSHETYEELGMLFCQKNMQTECMLVSTNLMKTNSVNIIPLLNITRIRPYTQLQTTTDESNVDKSIIKLIFLIFIIFSLSRR